MKSHTQHRLQIIAIIIALAWHALIIFSIFVLTRTDLKPLHITVRPEPIQYSLHSQANKQPFIKPQSSPNSQITQQEAHDDTAESYQIKNAVSAGTLSQGSVVNTTGTGDNQESQAANDEDDQIKPEQLHKSQQTQEPSNMTTTEALPQEQVISNDLQEPSKRNHEQPQQSITGFSEPLTQLPSDATSSLYTIPETNQQKMQSNEKASVPQPNKGQNKPARRTARPDAQRNIPPISNNLTLADLTRSYMQQLKQEQHATGRYNYKGYGTTGLSGPMGINGAYAPPTPGAELAEQIYAAKLYTLLEQSAQAYSRQIFALHDLEMQTTIEVSIDRTGQILDVTLNPSLPEKDMEQALCTIVKRVGMFPPIPKQFKKSRIILNIPIQIRSQKGFSSYHLLYGRRV